MLGGVVVHEGPRETKARRTLFVWIRVTPISPKNQKGKSTKIQNEKCFERWSASLCQALKLE